MLYKMKYSFRLWRRVRGMGILRALLYPVPPRERTGDPIEDADAEISYMRE